MFTPTGLADGQHTVVASETDAAGNTGTASLSFTLDTHAPAVTEALKNDTGTLSNDHLTRDPTLTGSGDPNAVVHFTLDGSLIAATATADNSGAWTFTPTNQVDGNHTVVASETDAAGNTSTASQAFVLDTTPPVVSVSVRPSVLYPPNHQLVEITANVTATDDRDPHPTISLASITSNQGDDWRGDGHTAPDIVVDNGKIFLRAERAGGSADRVYTITFAARDAAGNEATASGTVTVPHDQRK